MKPRDSRPFRQGVATVIRLDLLESRQLLSMGGAAGDVVEIDRSHAIAVSSSTVSANGVTVALKDASGTPTGDGAASQVTPAQSSASAATTTSVGDTSQKSPAGAATAQTAADPGKPGTGPVAPNVPAVVASASSDTTAEDEGAPQSAANPSAAAQAVPSVIASDVPGGVPSASPGTSSGNEAMTRPASGSPIAQQPGDLGWTIDAGSAPNAETDEATSDGRSDSPLASPQASSLPRVDGVVVVRPSDNGSSTLGLGPDGAAVMDDDGSAPLSVAAPARVRPTTGTDVIMDRTRSRGEGEISGARAGREPSSLRCADLLTEFLPFDRATLEAAIDSFLEPLDDLGSGWGSWSPSSSLVPTTTVVVGTALAAEIARRRLRGGKRAAEEGDEGFARLPGYAAAWGLGEP